MVGQPVRGTRVTRMPGASRPVRVALLAGVIVALVPTAAWAQAEAPREAREQVVISGDVAVPQGRTVGEVVVFSGSAMVLGVVQGDVIVVDGPVTIAGQVSGDVVALDGRLRLQATAQVAGDVIAGDEVEVAEGAQVAGAVTENVRLSLSGTVEVLGALLASISMAISSLVLMLVMLLLVPRGIERLGGAARTAPLASAGWGVLVAIVLPTVAVVLVATILGLPLGLAVLLGLALVFLVGLASAQWAIGRLVVPAPRSRVAALFAGWGIGAVAGLVPIANVAVWGLGAVFGLGTIVVAAWRARGTSKHRLGGVPPAAAETGTPLNAGQSARYPGEL